MAGDANPLPKIQSLPTGSIHIPISSFPITEQFAETSNRKLRPAARSRGGTAKLGGMLANRRRRMPLYCATRPRFHEA